MHGSVAPEHEVALGVPHPLRALRGRPRVQVHQRLAAATRAADRPPRTRTEERGARIGTGFAWLATWSLRLLLVVLGLYVLGQLIGRLWVVVLPVVLALLLASVLWAPTAWLRRHRVPPALAALLVVVGSLAPALPTKVK